MKQLLSGILMLVSIFAIAQKQQYQLDNWRPKDKSGVLMFEAPKDTVTNFEQVKVRVGGAFALQYQGIKHWSDADQSVPATTLYPIGNNFNLATANLDLDVALYDGVNMHLRTFLSSRHHPEAYVKGGYLQIDKLDFIKEGFAEDLMKYTTIKIGHDEINYGDAHFRRSDNAYAIANPFVGNLIMDAFATLVFAEVYYRRDGLIVMGGVTNGRLNQTASSGTSPSVYGKLGYDKQLSDDLRFRLTGSFYNTAETMRTDFYDGDRAGSRYYFVMENAAATSTGNFRSGQVIPGFRNKLTAAMINPFVKYKGFEFFGTYENTNGLTIATDGDRRRTFHQYAAEALYRFGENEKFYIGGRYNHVNGELASGDQIEVDRFNLGAGWFMTKNILTKFEYVNQKYNGYPTGSILEGGKFNGIVFEAVISF